MNFQTNKWYDSRGFYNFQENKNTTNEVDFFVFKKTYLHNWNTNEATQLKRSEYSMAN